VSAVVAVWAVYVFSSRLFFDFGSYSILPTRRRTLFSSHCRTLIRQKSKVRQN